MEQMEQMEQLKQMNIATLEGLFGFSRDAIDQFESAFSRQLELNMACVREGLKGSEALMTARNPQDLAQWQENYFRPGIERILEIGRQQVELSLGAQKEIGAAVQGRMVESTRQCCDMVDRMSESLPPNAKPLADAMRSMLTATTTALENMEKMASRMTEMAEANVMAINESATRATKAPASAGKRKAA